MRDHAIVSPHFWTGDTGRALRDAGPDAQRLALYLMTCPNSNMIGLYYLPMPTLCHELGIDEEGASKALRRGFQEGFCAYDPVTETVFVVEMARFQIGESLKTGDNRVKAIRKQAQQMRKSPFYNDFLDRYAGPFHLEDMPRNEGASKGLRRGFEGASGSARQDQDQEQDQGQDQETHTASPAGAGGVCEKNDATSGKRSANQRNRHKYPADFERWWALYPRREAKEAAAKAYRKALEFIDPEELDRITEQFAQSPKGKAGRYCPHPATWLNDKCWEDDQAQWQLQSLSAPHQSNGQRRAQRCV